MMTDHGVVVGAQAALSGRLEPVCELLVQRGAGFLGHRSIRSFSKKHVVKLELPFPDSKLGHVLVIRQPAYALLGPRTDVRWQESPQGLERESGAHNGGGLEDQARFPRQP